MGYCVVQTGTRTHLLTRSLNRLLAGPLCACARTSRPTTFSMRRTALHYVQDEKDNFPKFNPLNTKRIMETQQQQFDVDSFGAF